MGSLSLLAAARDGREPEAILHHHRDALRRLEDVAENCWLKGRPEDAVGTAATAAWLSGVNHPGVLASPRLEALLAAISRELPAPLPTPRALADPERVLVIVTETYEVGGHTRLLWRWIARDPGRVYSVVTTAQNGVMPEGVRAAVRASGGGVVDLTSGAPALERAAAIRALAADADIVVLLDHPHDPMATLAFAGLAHRPPIVMMNHGDHLFWLGRRIVDVLMCTRPLGTRFAARRGFPGTRVLATPFPVSGPDDHGRVARSPIGAEERAGARAALLGRFGWPADTVVLVTAGSEYKYEGVPGLRLLDLVEPVLTAAPQARLVAAGPEDAGRWRELDERTGGRVAALGLVPQGIGALHAAGDIYLESRPQGGPGATAEAAAHGLSVLGGAVTPLERELFVTDAAYGPVCAPDIESYRALLTRLIAEPALRAELGDAARRAIGAADDGWERAVEHAYALARASGRVDEAEFLPLPEPGDEDTLVDFANQTARRVAADDVERITSLYELCGRSPAVRRMFGPLEPTSPRQIGRYPVAFAAPAVSADALRAVISEFRTLSQMSVAGRFVIALEPGAAGEAVPVIEAALSEGTDVDVDLILDPEPSGQRPAGSLEVVVANGDGDGGDDCADRHMCAAPAVVV